MAWLESPLWLLGGQLHQYGSIFISSFMYYNPPHLSILPSFSYSGESPFFFPGFLSVWSFSLKTSYSSIYPVLYLTTNNSTMFVVVESSRWEVLDGMEIICTTGSSGSLKMWPRAAFFQSLPYSPTSHVYMETGIGKRAGRLLPSHSIFVHKYLLIWTCLPINENVSLRLDALKARLSWKGLFQVETAEF